MPDNGLLSWLQGLLTSPGAPRPAPSPFTPQAPAPAPTTQELVPPAEPTPDFTFIPAAEALDAPSPANPPAAEVLGTPPPAYFWPLAGRTRADTRVTNPFGAAQVFTPGYESLAGRQNLGVDLAASAGDPVVNPFPEARVVEVRRAGAGDPGWGNSIVLEDTASGNRVRLSHFQSAPWAGVGQIVRGGEQVGSVGQSGNATGPHVDVEFIRKGGQYDDFLSLFGDTPGRAAPVGQAPPATPDVVPAEPDAASPDGVGAEAPPEALPALEGAGAPAAAPAGGEGEAFAPTFLARLGVPAAPVSVAQQLTSIFRQASGALVATAPLPPTDVSEEQQLSELLYSAGLSYQQSTGKGLHVQIDEGLPVPTRFDRGTLRVNPALLAHDAHPGVTLVHTLLPVVAELDDPQDFPAAVRSLASFRWTDDKLPEMGPTDRDTALGPIAPSAVSDPQATPVVGLAPTDQDTFTSPTLPTPTDQGSYTGPRAPEPLDRGTNTGPYNPEARAIAGTAYGDKMLAALKQVQAARPDLTPSEARQIAFSTGNQPTDEYLADALVEAQRGGTPHEVMVRLYDKGWVPDIARRGLARPGEDKAWDEHLAGASDEPRVVQHPTDLEAEQSGTAPATYSWTREDYDALQRQIAQYGGVEKVPNYDRHLLSDLREAEQQLGLDHPVHRELTEVTREVPVNKPMTPEEHTRLADLEYSQQYEPQEFKQLGGTPEEVEALRARARRGLTPEEYQDFENLTDPGGAPYASLPSDQKAHVAALQKKIDAYTNAREVRTELRAAPKTDPELLIVLGDSVYPGNIPTTIVREMLQNATDAVRALADPSKAHIALAVDTRKNTITLSDNGVGMPPSVATHTFLEPAKSLKPVAAGESPSGGYGMGMLLAFVNAKSLHVETTAEDPKTGKRTTTTLDGDKDDYLSGVGFLVTIKSTPKRDLGTTITLTLGGKAAGVDPQSVAQLLRPMIETDRSAFRYDLSINGAPVKTDYWTADAPDAKPLSTRQIGTLDFKGGTGEVRATEETSEQTGVHVDVLNNGLYQFTKEVWLGGESAQLPNRVVFDVHAEKPPKWADPSAPGGFRGNPDYPFKLDRTGLRDEAERELSAYIKSQLQLDAVAKQQKLRQDTFTGGASLGDSGRTAIDSTGRLPRPLVEKIAADQRVRDLDDDLDLLYGSLMDRVGPLVARHNPRPLRYHGLGLGDDYLGIYVPGQRVFPGDPAAPDTILINPFVAYRSVQMSVSAGDVPREEEIDEFAAQLAATMVHEQVHHIIPAKGHGGEKAEDFSGRITRLMGRTASVQAELAREIAVTLRQNNNEVYDAIRDYSNELTSAFLAAGPGEDILGKIGVQSSAAVSGGDGGDPGGTGGRPGGGAGPAGPLPQGRRPSPTGLAPGADVP